MRCEQTIKNSPRRTLCGPPSSTSTEQLSHGVQERNGSNVPQVTYTRGPDLSGTMEDGGGIGGLLARSHGYSSGTGNWSTHNYYFADGNGNITYLVNSSQALAAKYRYDPFGNTISSSGSLASVNIYRFSSKEIHEKCEMYYYGYRFYAPHLERWVSSDPMAEAGFQTARGLPPPSAEVPEAHIPSGTATAQNLHTFLINEPLRFVDSLGLEIFPKGVPPPSPSDWNFQIDITWISCVAGPPVPGGRTYTVTERLILPPIRLGTSGNRPATHPGTFPSTTTMTLTTPWYGFNLPWVGYPYIYAY